MGVRVKKVSKTKIAVKASTPSGLRSVLRRLGVDPELTKGDQKKMDPAHLQAPGSGRNTTSRKSTAKKSTAKRATAKRATGKAVGKGGRTRRPRPSK